jgi:hypothetical protein
VAPRPFTEFTLSEAEGFRAAAGGRLGGAIPASLASEKEPSLRGDGRLRQSERPQRPASCLCCAILLHLFRALAEVVVPLILAPAGIAPVDHAVIP